MVMILVKNFVNKAELDVYVEGGGGFEWDCQILIKFGNNISDI